VPLVLADKLFNPSTGQLTFDSFETDGHLGDKVTVNGKIQPFFTVKRRKYRFRVLNGSQARFFNLVLRSGGTNKPFTLITESGNLLEAPVANLTRLEVQPAERFDIIVDFSKFAPGTEVILSNTMAMADGRGPNRDKPQNPDDVRFQLLKFKVSARWSRTRARSRPGSAPSRPSTRPRWCSGAPSRSAARTGRGPSTARSGTPTSTTPRSPWPTRATGSGATPPRSGR
jgi:FtsP/CotA-like multicopper oxidase with cupredoxin domain